MPRRARRAFERAAATYDAAAVLQREVGQRMAERLALVKLAAGSDPRRRLRHGRCAGRAVDALSGGVRARPRQRLRHARDRAPAQRRGARFASARCSRAGSDARATTGSEPALVCGDACRLPLAAGSVDLVWSNLTLQWINERPVAFGEFHRVLRSGGLLLFTTLGPDTLKELRSAFAGVDQATHVSRFIDMHDLGDMLVHAGFADPVMDMETITLTYADATDDDARTQGDRCAQCDARAGRADSSGARAGSACWTRSRRFAATGASRRPTRSCTATPGSRSRA